MKSLLASVAILATLVAGQDQQSKMGLNLLAASKSYLLGDGQYFGTGTGSTVTAFDNAYVVMGGNGDVQGFNQMGSDQTFTMPSWRWNSSFPGAYGGGVAGIYPAGANFLWFGKSSQSQAGKNGYYSMGAAEAATGKILWGPVWMPCDPTSNPGGINTLKQWNSTTYVTNFYACWNDYSDTKKNGGLTLTTVNVPNGWIVNLTSVDVNATALAAVNDWGIIPGWGLGPNGQFTSGTGNTLYVQHPATSDQQQEYNLPWLTYFWDQTSSPTAPMNKFPLQSQFTFSKACQQGATLLYPNASDSGNVWGLSRGTGSNTAGFDLKMTYKVDAPTNTLSVWTSTTGVYECFSSSSGSGVYYIDNGLNLAVWPATVGGDVRFDVQNIASGYALQPLAADSKKPITGISKSANVFYMYSTPSGKYTQDWYHQFTLTCCTTPGIANKSTPQKPQPGVELSPSSCVMSGSDIYCKTKSSSSSFSLVVKANVATTEYLSQTYAYQPAVPSVTLGVMKNNAVYLGEAGFISELGIYEDDTPKVAAQNLSSTAPDAIGGTNQDVLFWVKADKIEAYNLGDVDATKTKYSWWINATNTSRYRFVAGKTGVKYVSENVLVVAQTLVDPSNPSDPQQRLCAYNANVATKTNGLDSTPINALWCTGVSDLSICGAKALSSATTIAYGSDFVEKNNNLYFTIGTTQQTCVIQIENINQPQATPSVSGFLFANYYAQQSAAPTTCTENKNKCNDAAWNYGNIQNIQIEGDNLYATIIGSSMPTFTATLIAYTPLSSFSAGTYNRGALTSYTCGGNTYWQINGNEFNARDPNQVESPGCNTKSYAINFNVRAQIVGVDSWGVGSGSSNPYTVTSAPFFYNGYLYIGGSINSKPGIWCYGDNAMTPIWVGNLSSNTPSTKVESLFDYQGLIYAEADKSIATIVPQQTGSRKYVMTWEAPSSNTKVDHGKDGRVIVNNAAQIGAFSFLGRPLWESDVCNNGSASNQGAGSLDSNRDSSTLQSTVIVSCYNPANPNVWTIAALDRASGNIIYRRNYNKGITAATLGQDKSGTIWGYIAVGSNRGSSYASFKAPNSKPIAEQSPQFPVIASPTQYVTPVSGLGIETWNSTFRGFKTQLTDTGFGNVYLCSVDPNNGNQPYLGGISGTNGKLLWNYSLPVKPLTTSSSNVDNYCKWLKSLGPVVVYTWMNGTSTYIQAVNAMSGRPLYAPVNLNKIPGLPSVDKIWAANNATIFFIAGQTLHYFSVSSGQTYLLLDLASTAAWVTQNFTASNADTIAKTSSIVIATQDYAFWVTAFGEVRHFPITQARNPGETTAVKAHPAGNWAAVVRTRYYGPGYILFPSVSNTFSGATGKKVANGTNVAIIEWNTTSTIINSSIAPNPFSRYRTQTVQTNGEGLVYSVDWGMKGGQPIVLFMQDRYIQGYYLTGSNKGAPTYAATGVYYWFLKMAALIPVAPNNMWYLLDERSNIHVFDVNSGTFNVSFQLTDTAEDNYGFKNVYRPLPGASDAIGVGLTKDSLIVAFQALKPRLASGAGGGTWIYRINLNVDPKAPTQAFVSLYTVQDVRRIAVIQTALNPETVVVVGSQQFSAVNFAQGQEVVGYPEGEYITGNSWTYNEKLTAMYTTTNNGFAQGIDRAQQKVIWNVSLGAGLGKTVGQRGYLTNDLSKYVLVTNNASVCVFAAVLDPKQGGKGYFGTNKDTCFDLRTSGTNKFGKKCTFTNQQWALNAFITEADGNIYFASPTSNCIFQMNSGNPQSVKAVKFTYSYAHTPVAMGGSLYFSDGVYVYKLGGNQFTDATPMATTQKVLAVGATVPFQLGGNLYVGTTEGLVKLNGNLEVQWTTKTRGRILQAPVEVAGQVVVGDTKGYIYAVGQGGNVRWSLLAGYDPSNPTQIPQALTFVNSKETNTFLWITTTGTVAYSPSGTTVWSDFVNKEDRNVAGKYSFSIGRIFPIGQGCSFNLDVLGKTLYSKCGPTLVGRDVKSGQILFESAMPGARFAVEGTTLVYSGNTKIVQQTVPLPPLATPVPGSVTMAPFIWGYVATMQSTSFDPTDFVEKLSTLLAVSKQTVKIIGVSRAQSGKAVVEFRFTGVEAPAAFTNFNQLKLSAIQSGGVGIGSFSAIDTNGLPAETTPTINTSVGPGVGVIVLLVFIMLIALVATIVLVLVMTKIGKGRTVSENNNDTFSEMRDQPKGSINNA